MDRRISWIRAPAALALVALLFTCAFWPGASLTVGTQPAAGASPPPGSRTLHYASNTSGDLDGALKLGFNLIDVAGNKNQPARVKAVIDALPDGVKALVWVGNIGKKAGQAPGFSDAQFRVQVNGLAGDPKVFGYFLADEPEPAACPDAIARIRARADYVHARAPGQKTFITIVDGSNRCGKALGCEYAALAPAHTHVDLFGLDPYPCHFDERGRAAPCDTQKIIDHVKSAEANGIPAARIVPVFQTFGQEGQSAGKERPFYRLPTPAELEAMLATWGTVVPEPAFDWPYTYGARGKSSRLATLSSQPALQAVIQAHNQK
jgi:hypothetical protein